MIVPIVKPSGMTSHDVVDKVRKITNERRVGHGGTLDPFAEGVLVIGISRESTKKLNQILKNTEKEYVATIELGKTSTTGDPEGKLIKTAEGKDLTEISKAEINKILKKFTGEIEQAPHKHSAVKIGGVPAYKKARLGEEINLKKRKVKVYRLELIELNPPILKIRATVSSGTYIRVLAEDIGSALGVGAYTKELIRTRVGEFTLEKSKTLEELNRNYQNLYN